MGQYRCRFSSGQQFIFEGGPQWFPPGLLFTAALALFIGLWIGFTVVFGGVYMFERVIAIAAPLAARKAYACIFQRKKGSDDRWGYSVGCLTICGATVAVLVGVRCLLMLDIPACKLCLLFCLISMCLGLFLYGYVQAGCREDERKHQLVACDSRGTLPECLEHADSDSPSADDVLRFLRWIISGRWWHDVRDTQSAKDRGGKVGMELPSDENVVLHNHTLKLIKVCLYAPDDMFCWVPFGGVSGPCVGFVPAESFRCFLPPRHLNREAPAHYKLKVFQPGLFDKELALYPKVQRSQSIGFVDTEGLVRRSRSLSCASARIAIPPPCSGCSPDTSEDEAEATVIKFQTRNLLRQEPRAAALGVACGNHFCVSSASSSACGSRIQVSDDDFCLYSSSSACASQRQRGVRGDHAVQPARRSAALDEIVLWNRSHQDIRALLFRANDYIQMVPLVGNLNPSSDCIVPTQEQRFRPSDDAAEFTMKVYSSGMGARELTYFSVSRGHSYMFRDSLLT